MTCSLFVANEAEVRDKLQGGPAILLSASVPYRREPRSDVSSEEREQIELNSQAYLGSAEPVRIRSAVIALTRVMLMRGVRLVFGAHPAISPMVLSAAQDVSRYMEAKRSEPRQSGCDDPRILIFHSMHFKSELPEFTLSLAAWDTGLLVFTPEVFEEGGRKEAARKPSLECMRRLMVSVPDLRAAIFVGGMEGAEEEARLFEEHNPGKPIYALASTGSAAQRLWEENRSRYSGSLKRPESMIENLSYSVVATEILDDLGIKGA